MLSKKLPKGCFWHPTDLPYFKQLNMYKNVEFCIFLPEDKSRMRVYLFVYLLLFFFFPGVTVSTQGS